MRKLASVRVIKNLKPIDGADNIELAIVDGWQCVVKKGEFAIGDKCIYFEIDSFLPLGTYFDFLAKSGVRKFNGNDGIRLKTMRFKGALSQGLALPLNLFEPLINKNIELDTDVTTLLNIDKYENLDTNTKLSGEQAGHFPSYVKKTDQERIQNLFDKYKELYKGVPFEVSLKLDGTSMTIFSVDTKKYHTKDDTLDRYFGICSRNFELREKEDNTYWQVANKNNLKQLISDYCQVNNRNLAFQGELIGPGIQGNKEKLHQHDLYIFDIWDIDKQSHLSPKERLSILNELNLKSVPIMFEDFLVFDTFMTVEEILEFADGVSMNNDNREGFVFKAFINEEIISFKAISNRFLLKDK